MWVLGSGAGWERGGRVHCIPFSWILAGTDALLLRSLFLEAAADQPPHWGAREPHSGQAGFPETGPALQGLGQQGLGSRSRLLCVIWILGRDARLYRMSS